MDEPQRLADEADLVWRSVHPAWFVNGRLSSQAFRPTPKDQLMLSGASSRSVTAEEHFTEYTEDFGLESCGVWAISVGEAAAEGLPCWADEGTPQAPLPCPRGHVSIDFRGKTGAELRRVGQRLRTFAEVRGRIHPPTD